MTAFTIAELIRVLHECAGTDEDVDLDGDILDRTFEDLGYDSLALLNTAGRLERDLAIKLPDDAVSKVETPRQLLEEVNGRIRGEV